MYCVIITDGDMGDVAKIIGPFYGDDSAYGYIDKLNEKNRLKEGFLAIVRKIDRP